MSDLSDSFVAFIAQGLNSAHIPCVLWGHYLLNVHGVPSIIGSIDFVIPDDCLEKGRKALAQIEKLTQCPDPKTCLASSKERYTPPSAFHVHIKDSEVTVELFPQSETVWFLPPLINCLTSSKTLENLPPQLVLASDKTTLPPRRPGRGSGRFESDHDFVIVPKSHILLEAFLRLYARDSGKRIGSFGMAMIAYMEEYVDDDGFLDSDLLPEPLRTFYKELRQGTKPVRQWTDELKEALGVPFEDSDDDRTW